MDQYFLSIIFKRVYKINDYSITFKCDMAMADMAIRMTICSDLFACICIMHY